ncbi:hypothetical protein [Streptomyces sp. AS58]|nr:hypothetical protein [Streptomyces sp. AS58]
MTAEMRSFISAAFAEVSLFQGLRELCGRFPQVVDKDQDDTLARTTQ